MIIPPHQALSRYGKRCSAKSKKLRTSPSRLMHSSHSNKHIWIFQSFFILRSASRAAPCSASFLLRPLPVP